MIAQDSVPLGYGKFRIEKFDAMLLVLDRKTEFTLRPASLASCHYPDLFVNPSNRLLELGEVLSILQNAVLAVALLLTISIAIERELREFVEPVFRLPRFDGTFYSLRTSIEECLSGRHFLGEHFEHPGSAPRSPTAEPCFQPRLHVARRLVV